MDLKRKIKASCWKKGHKMATYFWKLFLLSTLQLPIVIQIIENNLVDVLYTVKLEVTTTCQQRPPFRALVLGSLSSVFSEPVNNSHFCLNLTKIPILRTCCHPWNNYKASIGTFYLGKLLQIWNFFTWHACYKERPQKKNYFKSVKFCSTLISAKNFFWLWKRFRCEREN